jgi:ribosomal protein S12 methylthiotransferase accessory factor
MKLIARFQRNPTTHLVENIHIDIQVPQEFPQKYTNAVIKAAGVCAVKRHLEQPPQIDIKVIPQ